MGAAWQSPIVFVLMVCAGIASSVLLIVVQMGKVANGSPLETLENPVVGPCEAGARERAPLACVYAMCSFEERRIKWRINLSTMLLVASMCAPFVVMSIVACTRCHASQAMAAAVPVFALTVIVGGFVMKQFQDFFFRHGHDETYSRCKELVRDVQRERSACDPFAGWELR